MADTDDMTREQKIYYNLGRIDKGLETIDRLLEKLEQKNFRPVPVQELVDRSEERWQQDKAWLHLVDVAHEVADFLQNPASRVALLPEMGKKLKQAVRDAIVYRRG